MDGKTHALSDYKGKIVVVNFWATWCPPCRFEMPSMERAQALTADNDVVFLGINVGEDADTIFTFTADYPVTFPLLMDINSEIIEQYPVVGLPTTYVIDTEGHMVYQAIGTRDWDNATIVEQLKALKQ
jgi:thiol-disulfide isomerase/thioredoxin